MKIFVSIATYNERENIEKLIREIFVLGIENLSLIVIDDNSPDGTAQIVETLQKDFSQLYLIKRSGKLGYGSAHLAGFKLAMAQGADIIVSMDADFSHQPAKIPELVAAIQTGSDVAIGSRKIAGGEVVGWSLWRKFCSAGAMTISQIILGIKTRDLTSGFRAYRREVFDQINLDMIKSNGYSFLEELIYLVEKQGLRIKEVPIVFYDRRLGHSKLSKKEIVNFFITIFRIKFSQKLKMSAIGGSACGGRILMITRKVDPNDALAGFAYNWVKKIGENLDKLYVITWQKSERGDLPSNIEIISLPENKWRKIFALQLNLLKIVPKIDGVFCHMNPEYTILAAPLAKLLGKKVVSWYTHKAVTWRRRLVELMADKILTASKDSFRQPWFKDKVVVTGHGIDLELFFPVGQVHQTLTCRLLSIGRISPAKDYESMIKAVDILKQQRMNVGLAIIGDIGLQNQKIYYNELMAIVSKMDLQESVKFIGAVPNNRIGRYLGQAEIFINLSNTGSLDKAVLEAMASGIIVLTSNEAFKDILPSELIVEKNNPQKLADKISWVMGLSENDETALRERMEQEVRNNHNLDNLAKKIVAQFYAQ